MKINKPLLKNAQLTVKLTEPMLTKLKSIAHKNNVSVNFLINQLLDKALS